MNNDTNNAYFWLGESAEGLTVYPTDERGFEMMIQAAKSKKTNTVDDDSDTNTRPA